MSEKLRTGEDTNVLRFPRPKQHLFRVGEQIRFSGIYSAIHGDHRVSHEVTLLAGYPFPRCNKCGAAVRFELVRQAPASIHDRAFKIQLFEIPHPFEDEQAQPIGNLA